MAASLLLGRGAVFRMGNASSSSYIKIPGLDLNGDGKSFISPQDISSQDSDIFTPVVTASNNNVLYEFGKNFGEINITLKLYLGCVEEQSSSAVKKVKEWFEKSRVSKKKSPIQVSLAGGGLVYRVYPYSLMLGQTDPMYNTQIISFKGVIAPIPS